MDEEWRRSDGVGGVIGFGSEDVEDLLDEAVAERAVAAADPELAGAEAAEGVAARDEGRALVPHHAHAAHVHHLLLPPLAVVIVVLTHCVLAGAGAGAVLLLVIVPLAVRLLQQRHQGHLRGRRLVVAFLPTPPTPNPKAKPLSLRLPTRRLSMASSAVPSGAAAAARERRRFLERYGLNPDDFEDDVEANPREGRRDRRRRRSGRGEEAAEAAVAPAEPRETHKLLQVLGGKVRRRKLLSPKDRNVRPMMEVVRGAAFDILQSAGGSPASLRPGRWLDLYSGTGSVGIEAMSRGCSEAYFVEMDPWVVSEVLKPNLECTGFLDVSHIHMIRVENFLANAEKSKGKYPSFDYISVTPPYLEVNYSTLLDQLARSPLVGEDCFILVEYPLKTEMAESCGNLIKIADRRFGRTNLLIYGPTWSEKKKR